MKVRKRAKIRIRYNQAPHLTQYTDGKVTTSQLYITNESQEVSPFQAEVSFSRTLGIETELALVIFHILAYFYHHMF